MTGRLRITFVDSVHELDPTDELKFGRGAQLDIDDNEYLHREVGRFAYRQGLWWLQNHSDKLLLRLQDRSSRGFAGIAPGQQMPITYDRFVVRFSAGPTAYEIEGECEVEGGLQRQPASVAGETREFGVVPVSGEQHLLLVALCAPVLRGDVDLATNQQIADLFGWTITKFNRKLDSLCAKFSNQGVRGLRGSSGSLAMDRRQVLIDHALTAKLVTADDLGLLKPFESTNS